MEPRGCNRWHQRQIGSTRKPRNEAETVALGCDQLPEAAPGKEGVDSGTVLVAEWRITGAYSPICRIFLSSLGLPEPAQHALGYGVASIGATPSSRSYERAVRLHCGLEDRGRSKHPARSRSRPREVGII
jgi:hypothetical protein